ncbi:hypothetical protein [Nocardioides sp. NPDC006273]|uniref:hypothetical protein n=1 Tax=Actinomycetes TaxID=1760 RepID=UPI0033B3C2D3
MTDRLYDAAQRALDSLNDLIRNTFDPGVEALGARYELAHVLSDPALMAARAAARQTTGQDDTKPAPWTADGRHGPTPDEAAAFLRFMATQHPAAAHCCTNCDGIDPDSCLNNPDRPKDPTTADDPTPLRWGLGDVLHGDDDTTIVCLSGPDRKPYWLELDPERAAAFRQDLTPPAAGQDGIERAPSPGWRCAYCGLEVEDRGHPLIQEHSNWYPIWVHVPGGYSACHPQKGAASTRATPAVGQPAEAHDTEVRERVRLAIAQQYLDDTGSGRTVDELDDTEFGSLADAALSALTVEDER